MEDIIFICHSCGEITKIKSDDLLEKEGLKHVCNCGSSLFMKNSYPNLFAQDFVQSASDLFDICRKTDKENLTGADTFLKQNFDVLLDKSTLDSYINLYEHVREKYRDNDPDQFNEISDEYENKLMKKKLSSDLIYTLVSVMRLFNKNKFRKPFVIIMASLMEQLFNDYFSLLIQSKLSNNGTEKFLSEYETAGIKTCLNICNAFLDKPLICKMNLYSNGFFDRWSSLISLRNSIIHSNNKFT